MEQEDSLSPICQPVTATQGLAAENADNSRLMSGRQRSLKKGHLRDGVKRQSEVDVFQSHSRVWILMRGCEKCFVGN